VSEFDDIVAGLFDEEADAAARRALDGAAGGHGSDSPADRAGTTPGAGEAGPPPVAVLLTGLPSVDLLVALCSLSDVAAWVGLTDAGAVAVLDDAGEEGAHEAAARLSQAMQGASVALLRRGPSEDPAAQDMQVVAYAAGVRGEMLPPGLVMAQLPVQVEDLVLGLVEAPQLKDAVHSRTVSAVQATKLLVKGARRLRKSMRRQGVDTSQLPADWPARLAPEDAEDAGERDASGPDDGSGGEAGETR
jgi:hypothetical protein